MEYWNVENPGFVGAGILGIKAEINYLNCQKILRTHHFNPVKLFHISQGPLLHYSLRGAGPTLRPGSPTGWKRGRRPIWAKPLT
jgi:hypothetical protein